MSKANFITSEGLLELKNYKYKPGKYTKIDNLLNPYWEWVVSLVPMWVAPNVITFVGWILVILSYVNILRFDYTFQKDIPNWCFFFIAGCIWAYSTLDAIDGKQARRTKSSSPLGQLFDHGCDSFSITFFILALGQAAKLDGLEIFILFFAFQCAFWTSNWMQYNTGILKTNVGEFGVTQSELISMIIHFITGIFGQKCWQIKIIDILPTLVSEISQNWIWKWTLQLKLGGFIAYYFGGLTIFLCIYSFFSTIIYSKDKIKPILEWLTFWIIVLLMSVWYLIPFFDQYKGLILLNFGLIFSLIICKMIISSVAKMRLQAFHLEIVPMIVSTILIVICEAIGMLQARQYIFWFTLAINLYVILNFLYHTINQITKYLDINCFSLKYRPIQISPTQQKKVQ